MWDLPFHTFQLNLLLSRAARGKIALFLLHFTSNASCAHARERRRASKCSSSSSSSEPSLVWVTRALSLMGKLKLNWRHRCSIWLQIQIVTRAPTSRFVWSLSVVKLHKQDTYIQAQARHIHAQAQAGHINTRTSRTHTYTNTYFYTLLLFSARFCTTHSSSMRTRARTRESLL